MSGDQLVVCAAASALISLAGAATLVWLASRRRYAVVAAPRSHVRVLRDGERRP